MKGATTAKPGAAGDRWRRDRGGAEPAATASYFADRGEHVTGQVVGTPLTAVQPTAIGDGVVERIAAIESRLADAKRRLADPEHAMGRRTP